MNQNKTEYKIFGVRRSGMHAVMYWLARHHSEKVWFANDLNSFNSPREPKLEFPETYEPEEYISPLDVPDFWEQDKNVLMSCCEDMSFLNMDWDSNREGVGGSDKYSSLLVIRDPFNLFASRCKIGMVFDNKSKMIWKQHAREALGETSFLKNKVVVNYNKWFSDEHYRRVLESSLGLGMSDEGIQRVYGLGSSFTGRTRDGDGLGMRVMDRWNYYSQNAIFMSFFDSEMVRMAWALFGNVPPCFMGMVI